MTERFEAYIKKSNISVTKAYIKSVNIMVCKISIHLDIRNGTYGSLAFISGVGNKNISGVGNKNSQPTNIGICVCRAQENADAVVQSLAFARDQGISPS